MKVCVKCNMEKQFIDFKKHQYTKDGYTNKCIKCLDIRKYSDDFFDNKIFGEWTVIGISKNKYTNRKCKLLCKCSCGTIKDVDRYVLMKGQSLSCGHNRGELIRKLHSLKDPTESAFNTVYKHYKDSAKKRNYEFHLTKEQFREIIETNCYYCGKIPDQKYNKGRETYIHTGVDRFNNKMGYVIENCVSCCKTCNSAKNELSFEEFIKHIKNIFKIHGEKI